MTHEPAHNVLEIRIQEAWMEKGPNDAEALVVLKSGDNVSEFTCPTSAVKELLGGSPSLLEMVAKLPELPLVVYLTWTHSANPTITWTLGIKRKGFPSGTRVALVKETLSPKASQP